MMKKLGQITIITAVVGTFTYAADMEISERIIGLEIGASQIQADTNGDGIFGEPDHDGSDIEYGFRIGAQMNEWRTLLVLNYFDSSDDDQNYEKGMLTVDYMFMNDERKVEGFQPYIGLNVGYMNYESTNIDENGLLYGGQVGMSYRVTETVSVDLSYRYSLTSADRTDHIQGVIFGLNYIY